MTRVALRNQIRSRMISGDWAALEKEYRFKARFIEVAELDWSSLSIDIRKILAVGAVDSIKASKFWYSRNRRLAGPTPKNLRPNREHKMPAHHWQYTPEQRAQYARDRAWFLVDNPWCQVAWLVRKEKVKATHVHHKKGRGPHYLDKSTFVATTADGDTWIHQNPEKARELGLLE